MTKGYRWLLIGDEHSPAPHPGSSASPPLPDAQEIHLFVRGYESIRILIRPATKTVQVFGPGRVQKLQEFTRTADLEEFLKAYEQGVLENGWTLLDVTDRRIANRS
jgi:hypothetical protein